MKEEEEETKGQANSSSKLTDGVSLGRTSITIKSPKKCHA
jgi:hypothetical protein